MEVLGIIGSPRVNKNTVALVEKVLAGARKAGATTRALNVARMDVNPCMACDACRKTGNCVQRDEMQDIYEAIAVSRALVLGTPVYFDQVSAQAKAFIDRLYCYCENELGKVNFPAGFKAVVAITYEDSHPTRYDYILDWMKERLEHYHHIEVTEALKAPDTAQCPVSGNEALLESAFQAGRLLGEHVKAL